jgi:hypothetical protein
VASLRRTPDGRRSSSRSNGGEKGQAADVVGGKGEDQGRGGMRKRPALSEAEDEGRGGCLPRQRPRRRGGGGSGSCERLSSSRVWTKRATGNVSGPSLQYLRMSSCGLVHSGEGCLGKKSPTQYSGRMHSCNTQAIQTSGIRDIRARTMPISNTRPECKHPNTPLGFGVLSGNYPN